MNGVKKLHVVLLIALLAASISTSYVFAQVEPDEEILIEGVGIGEALIKAGPIGAFAGVLMSAIRVFGKNIKHEPGAKPDPKKFGLNILIGAVSAVIVTVTGVDSYLGLEAGELGLGAAFVLLYVVNQVIRPIYGNWIKGEKANKDDTQPK